MFNLILRIRNLQVLALKYLLWRFRLDVIAKNGKTLHKLHLLDYETYGFDHTPDTILSVPSLQYLQRKCPFPEDVMFVYDPHSKNVSGTRRSPGPCALTLKY